MVVIQAVFIGVVVRGHFVSLLDHIAEVTAIGSLKPLGFSPAATGSRGVTPWVF
jgi:hypothetical protein